MLSGVKIISTPVFTVPGKMFAKDFCAGTKSISEKIIIPKNVAINPFILFHPLLFLLFFLKETTKFTTYLMVNAASHCCYNSHDDDGAHHDGGDDDDHDDEHCYGDHLFADKQDLIANQNAVDFDYFDSVAIDCLNSVDSVDFGYNIADADLNIVRCYCPANLRHKRKLQAQLS